MGTSLGWGGGTLFCLSQQPCKSSSTLEGQKDVPLFQWGHRLRGGPSRILLDRAIASENGQVTQARSIMSSMLLELELWYTTLFFFFFRITSFEHSDNWGSKKPQWLSLSPQRKLPGVEASIEVSKDVKWEETVTPDSACHDPDPPLGFSRSLAHNAPPALLFFKLTWISFTCSQMPSLHPQEIPVGGSHSFPEPTESAGFQI
jgi:hypothetical protein